MEIEQAVDYLNATIYGVVQGLAEFLPISSSGHLALLPKYLGIIDPGVAFDLAMHVGTALAVVIYFHREVGSLLVSTFQLLHPGRKRDANSFFALNLIIATITTIVIALAVKDLAASWGRGVEIIAINLMIFAVLMSLADLFAPVRAITGKLTMERQLMWKNALLIGLFQGMAVFPGVSRSGATLTISRWLGLTRSEATRFSFVLSLPIILGGFITKLPELSGEQAGLSFYPLLWGGVISLVVGILTIIFFLKFIERVGLLPFALYRIFLAAAILGGL
ncbi:MAG: undecaprenyl-diphosphate phosphatase [Bdellovibrionales bacterium]|nr:undecaprenyl-diphosphate phosphatase [Bdellovibrionales bacterium]